MTSMTSNSMEDQGSSFLQLELSDMFQEDKSSMELRKDDTALFDDDWVHNDTFHYRALEETDDDDNGMDEIECEDDEEDIERPRVSVEEPSAVAEAVYVDTTPTSGVHPLTMHHADFAQQPAIGYTRAEFLFARVTKETPSSTVGISFSERKQPCKHRRRKAVGAIISRIEPDGLFARTNIRVGDRVLSVNNVSCLTASPAKVARLIRMAANDVALVVHHPTGDPSIVSSCVQKPPSATRVGVAIRNTRGALLISKVSDQGLFAGTFLAPGHRCLMVNETITHNMPSLEAARLLSECTGQVTIVSRPREEMAVVLACDTHRRWWSRLAILSGIAAGTLSAVQIVT